MFNSLQEFVDYVWAFYNPQSELYPIKGLTIEDVFQAIFTYKQRLLKVSYNDQTTLFRDGMILLDADSLVTA